MAENLKVTKYNDGAIIPLVTERAEWANLSTPGYCWMSNNKSSHKNRYGALYNWYTVNTCKLCPTGWHVPTIERTILTDYLGGEDVAGGKLKEEGTANWNSPNEGATNETGFTARPGGSRDGNGRFWHPGYGYKGLWWSSSEFDEDRAWCRQLNYDDSSLFRYDGSKIVGMSVRCVKD